jgi:ACS family glucarate transporter-like MFS transporter
LPVFLQQGRHISENEMKLITSSVFLISIPVGIIAGITSDWLVKRKGLKFSRRLLGKIALGMMGIMILIIALSTNKTTLIFCLVTGHMFMPFSMVVSFSTCMDIGGENTGSVTGIMNFFGQLSAFFLLIFFGKIVDYTHDFNTPLFAISGVLFIGFLLWFFIDPTKKIKTITSENLIINKIIPLAGLVQKME